MCPEISLGTEASWHRAAHVYDSKCFMLGGCTKWLLGRSAHRPNAQTGPGSCWAKVFDGIGQNHAGECGDSVLWWMIMLHILGMLQVIPAFTNIIVVWILKPLLSYCERSVRCPDLLRKWLLSTRGQYWVVESLWSSRHMFYLGDYFFLEFCLSRSTSGICYGAMWH